MTSVDDGTAVAESLSTIGYAMFALLENGPLADIPSLNEFMLNLQAEEAAAHQIAAAAEQAAIEQATESAFGQHDVGETMGAYTPPPGTTGPGANGVPTMPTVPTSFGTSVHIPTGPPDPETLAAAAAAAATASTEPEQDATPHQKPPLEPASDYTVNETMHMLREISFLDE